MSRRLSSAPSVEVLSTSQSPLSPSVIKYLHLVATVSILLVILLHKFPHPFTNNSCLLAYTPHEVEPSPNPLQFK